MNRRDLVKAAGFGVPASALAASNSIVAAVGKAARACDQPRTVCELRNREWRMELRIGEGMHIRLEHVPSGAILADAVYFCSFGNAPLRVVEIGDLAIKLRGTTSTGLAIEHHLALGRDECWLEERVRLTNAGSAPLDLHDARCGFVLPIRADSAQQTFTAVPFRREPSGSRAQYSDFSAKEILSEPFESGLWERFTIGPTPWRPRSTTSAYASEGWIWRHANLAWGFLVSKYSTVGLEWSILDRVPVSAEIAAIRWGGVGIYRSHPERGAWLAPGASHSFGVTRLTPFKGQLTQGFYVFRDEMAKRGHGCPPTFDPPVHWNELYDNKLYSSDFDSPEARRKYYSLDDMKEAAQKARAMGCDALYLDPGWDTSFASKIWDDSRLGTFKAFTQMLAREYGLKCSLHTPLSGWCNPSSYPQDCHRLDRSRERLDWQEAREVLGVWAYLATPICGASQQYLDETLARLLKLAREGASFFMFDGTQYQGDCWDDQHGHEVPARIEAHTEAMLRLARRVHEEFPEILIEMHDPVVGGFHSHYTPMYYGHGRPSSSRALHDAAGFDSAWAFELMWKPMEDLVSGKSLALYYYNLSYALPLYIHIDLRTDNESALVFWWNASTCRHLGVGGTHPNPAVVSVHKEAIKTYQRLKRHFSQGTFHGIDEYTHVHTAPDRRSAVINCFNLQELPVEREILINPVDFNLDVGRAYRFSGAVVEPRGAAHALTVSIVARGHTLVEMS